MERLLNAGGMNEKCDADRSVKDQRCTWSFLSCPPVRVIHYPILCFEKGQ